MLFQRFKINYNEISARFRKGSVVVREKVGSYKPWFAAFNDLTPIVCQVREPEEQDTGDSPEPVTTQASESVRIPLKASQREKPKMTIEVLHCDIISDEFWDARPHLLAS